MKNEEEVTYTRTNTDSFNYILQEKCMERADLEEEKLIAQIFENCLDIIVNIRNRQTFSKDNNICGDYVVKSSRD